MATNSNKYNMNETSVKEMKRHVTDNSIEAIRVLQLDTSGTPIGGDVTLAAVDSGVTLNGDAYDSSLDADKVAVINGPQFHYTAPETILELPGDAAATYRAVFNVQSYPFWSLHVIASGGVTYTMYVTNIDGASDTDETDGNWLDYSSTILGAASVVDTNGFYMQDTKLPALKVMLKAVSSDTSNVFSATLVKSA